MASLGQNEANNHHNSEVNLVEQDCKISSSDYSSVAAASRPTNGTSSTEAEIDDSDPVQPSASSNGTTSADVAPVDEESPSTGNLDDEDLSNEGVGMLSSTYGDGEQKNNSDPSGVLPCDSVSSSSCPVSGFNAGPSEGEIDSEVQRGSGQYHQVTSGAEDDAGSSSHSEVRSSSPGVADADADVEDSPSGEETGSESEQRTNHHSGASGSGIEPTSSSGIMYAPNTVGFPPSRATTLTTAGCFGSSYKFVSSSGSTSGNGSSSGQNPFAPRPSSGSSGGFAAVAASTTSSNSTFRGRGERCTSSSSNTSYGASSNTGFGSLSGRGASTPLISPGRFNTAGGGGSLPSSSSSCTSPKVAPSSSSWSSRPIIRPSALGSSLGAGGVNPSERAPNSIFGGASSSSSAFPNYFAMASTRGADSSENGEAPRSFVLKPSRLATTAGSSFGATSTTGEASSVPETSSSTDRSIEGAENGGPVFVPLANDNEIKAENPTPAPVTTSTATSSSDRGGFVFGQGLQDRVSSMGESTGVSNGIGSSSGADGGLFSSALQNLQKEPSKPVARDGEAGPSSTSETRPAFGSVDDDAQGDRKRKFDDAPVFTGEEDEMNVLQIMCKLFIFDKETSNWTERGRGQLRLNDRNDPDSHELRSRLIIRTKGSLRLMLNTNVSTGMQIGKPSAKSVRFTAVENGQVRLFLVVISVTEADQLFNALDWRLKNLKQQEENARSSQPEEEAPSTSKPDATEAINDEQSDDDDDEDHNDDMPAKKKRYVASSPGEPSSRKSSGDYSTPNSQNPSIQVTNHDEAP